MSKRENIEDIYPLTPMQEGILFHSLYDRQTPTYLVQLSFRLHTEFEISSVRESLNRLIKRYDIFRTAFVYEGVNRPMQVVLKERKPEFYYEDKRGVLAKDEQEIFLRQFKEKDKLRYFDFVKDILLRVALIRLEDFEYELIWSFHHILMDGWCLGIIISDFFQIYKSVLENRPHYLPEVKPYKIYIQWLEKKDKEKSKNYWSQYIQDYEGIADIPKKATSHKQAIEYNNEEVYIPLTPERTRKFNQVTNRNKVTLSTLFQVAWGILLGKYNRREDVIFGAVVSGRPSEIEAVETMIGLFINSIPVRIRYDRQPSLKLSELLKKTQEDAIHSENHHYYPLAEVQRESRLKQNLITHVLAFENFPITEQLSKLAPSKKEGGTKTNAGIDGLNVQVFEQTNYDFNVIIMPADEFKIAFKYNGNIYEKEFIKRIGAHLVILLDQILKNEEVKVKELTIISEEEQREILYDFNMTAAEYPQDMTIHRLFEECVEVSPDRIAIVFDDNQVTYNELNGKAEGLGRILRLKGGYPGILTALLLRSSIELITAILAVLKAGGAYLPIDPEYPRERIIYMLDDCGTKLLITTPNLDSHIPFSGVKIYPGDEAKMDENFSKLESLGKPRDLAYVIYTSGTTGRPKGVMIDHKNVVRLLFNDAFAFNFNDDDVWTMFHSYCFDFSVWEMYGALLYGAKLVLIPKMDARDTMKYLEIIKKEGVTVLNQTPSAFYNLMSFELSEPGSALRLRYIVFGGEALNPGRLKEWKKKYPGTKLINMYGITETTVHVTFKEIGDEEIETDISNVGKPIPTLRIYVLDQNLDLQPVGIEGELCVGGDGVGWGYLNRPELTAEKFISILYINRKERLYRSGDSGCWLPDGDIEYRGRIDQQVKIRGFRIEVGEIENCLLKYEGIKDVVVVPGEDLGQKYLIAYFEGEGSFSHVQLREYLLSLLPDYMVPSFFVQLEKIPLTSNGKVDRKNLPKPDEHAVISGIEHMPPTTETEKKLAAIWENILSARSIGIKDSFFNMGGDSIKAIKTISVINKDFGINSQIADLYTHDTIEKYAALIENRSDISSPNEYKEISAQIEQLKDRVLKEIQYPETIEDVYPLSDIETGMVFYSLKDLSSAMYHDQFAYQFKLPDFKVGVFKQALELLVEIHSILRTGFLVEDFEEPVQLVYNSISLAFNYYDISDKKKREQEQHINEFIQRDRGKRFNVAVPPLWRVALFILGADNICFLMIFHHAILDGWSLASLMTELNNTYLRLTFDPSYIPQKLKNSYREFVVEQIAEKRKTEVVEYWKNELEDYKRLDFSGLKDGDSSIQLKRYRKHFDEEFLEKLREVARNYSTDIKNLCFAAYIYMLNMLCYEADILVGLVTNNRPVCEDGDKILGCFLNTPPIRIRIPTNIKWSQYIRMIDDKLVEFKKYDRISLSEILHIIGEKTQDQNPLFDTLFNYVDFHVYQQADPRGAKGNMEDPLSLEGYEQTNTLLDFDVSATFGVFQIVLSYSGGLLGDKTIAKLVTYLENILNKIIWEPGEFINKDDLIPAEEKQKLLEEFNDTKKIYPDETTICRLFEKQQEKKPDHIAVVGPYAAKFVGRKHFHSLMNVETSPSSFIQITYHELNEKSDQFAYHLKEKGVVSEIIVGIMVERSIEIIIGILGILKAEGAYLPIDPDYPKDRIDYMLKDSRAKILITTSTFGKASEELRTWENMGAIETVFLDCLESFHSSPYRLPTASSPKPFNLAYVIYTSGTTGKPKAVMVQNDHYVNAAFSWKEAYRLDKMEVNILQLAAFSFDVFGGDIARALLNGGKLVICPNEIKLNMELLHRLIVMLKISLFEATPSLVIPLMEHVYENRLEVGHLSLLILGSDICPTEDFKLLNSRFGKKMRIINSYGLTETTIDTSFFEKTSSDAPLSINVPIGKPLSNMRMYILDSGRRLQPMGIAGELYIGGKGVARGYLNNQEISKDRFSPDPFFPGARLYKTGDNARWLSNGNMDFLGRIDHQVKIRGFRIELGEIENHLLQREDIGSAVVVAKESDSGDKYLCAYITAAGNIENLPSTKELRDYLSQTLPGYMLPGYFIFLEKIPLTSSGKVDRKALPSPEISREDVNYIAPVNEIEKKLAGIWSDVLGLATDKISVDANFFELGGHSLSIINLISAIHKKFNVRIQIQTIFERPTIRLLSKYLNSLKKDIYSSIEPVEKREYHELSPAQKRLFSAHQMDPRNINYNIMDANEVPEMDKDKLEKTLRKLIKRHESLRTSFEIVKNDVVQRIHDEVDFNVEYLDIRSNHGDVRGIIQNFVRPFNLSQPPLLRVGLVEVKADTGRYLLLVDMHHIITDGVSSLILVRDFMALYSGEELMPLRLQYKDYAQWQNSEEIRQAVKMQVEFWAQLFKGDMPVLNLPLDYPRPEIQSFEGNVLDFTLNNEKTSAIKLLLKEEDVTLFMLILAVLNVMLSKICRQEDIVVGTNLVGRRHADLEGMIGFFVNQLPLRNFPIKEKTFVHFLAEVKKHVLEAFENQDCQLEELVARLGIKRNPARHPLFDVLFTLHKLEKDYEKQIEMNGGLESMEYRYQNPSAKYDMILSCVEGTENLFLSLEYTVSLFRKDTIQRFIGYFKDIVDAVIENKHIRLEDIRISHDLVEIKSSQFSEDLENFEI